ncbi:MAG: class I SAM-dependent methyltransferase [Propionibacteriaceae bacterium]
MISDAAADVAATFESLAPDYDQSGVAFFGPIADRLVTLLAPVAGEHAVDLGCGRGAVTLPLASAVGVDGHVTAIDLAPAMVAATRDATDGLSQVETLVADVSSPPLPDGAADVVTASLVVFFLPDPAAAVRRWLRLLRPGGRLAITTFGPQDVAWRAVDELFTPYLPTNVLDARTSGRTGPFDSVAGVDRLLGKAGATNVSTVEERLPVRFVDVDQWRRFSLGTGQRRLWGFVPEPERPALLAAAADLLELARTPDGSIEVSQVVRYTLARAT